MCIDNVCPDRVAKSWSGRHENGTFGTIIDKQQKSIIMKLYNFMQTIEIIHSILQYLKFICCLD